MPNLPRLNIPGYQLLADALHAIELRVEGLDRRRAISERPSPKPLIIRQKTVVVVERPTADDTSLVVREVRYGTLPPGPPPAAGQQAAIGAAIAAQTAQVTRDAIASERRDPDDGLEARRREEPPNREIEPERRPDVDFEELPGPIDLDPENPLYEWAGDPFDAFPDYGQSALAYEFSFWDPETQGVPTADTAFLRCRREHDSWITELPGGGTVSFAVLRGYQHLQEQVLFVQMLQKPSDFVGQWTLSSDAPLVKVFTFGGLKAIEYIQHLVVVDKVHDYTPVLVIVNDGQHRFALHLFKFLVGTYQPPLNDWRVTDCVP